ncbi:hypothetical protein GQ457_07G016090 [Hibiscus cannabinus]
MALVEMRLHNLFLRMGMSSIRQLVAFLGPPELRNPTPPPPPLPQPQPQAPAVPSDPFMDAMVTNFKKVSYSPPMGFTENSSPTYLSSGNPCLHFFFHVVPASPPDSIKEMLGLAWPQDPLTTLKLDREGFYTSAFGYFKGLLQIFYRMLEGPTIRQIQNREHYRRKFHKGRGSVTPSTSSEEKRLALAKMVLERYSGDPCFIFLHELVLKADLEFMKSNPTRKIGLAAKWCPSLYSSFDDYPEYQCIEEAHRVRDRLRKQMLVPLRKILELPEVYIGAYRWDSIPYKRVASVAMKDLFLKHDNEGVQILKSGKSTIAAGALLPSLEDEGGEEVAELQWKRMFSDLLHMGKLRNCMAICDVSGSEEPWKVKLITFSPEGQSVQGETFSLSSNWDGAWYKLMKYIFRSSAGYTSFSRRWYSKGKEDQTIPYDWGKVKNGWWVLSSDASNDQMHAAAGAVLQSSNSAYVAHIMFNLSPGLDTATAEKYGGFEAVKWLIDEMPAGIPPHEMRVLHRTDRADFSTIDENDENDDSTKDYFYNTRKFKEYRLEKIPRGQNRVANLISRESFRRLKWNIGNAFADKCPDTQQPSAVEETVVHPVSNQQRAEESSYGPWMVVERRQRKPLNKQVMTINDKPGMIFQGSRFNPLRASEESVDAPSEPLAEPPVVSLADFPVLNRNHGKASSSSRTPLDQLRHTAVVIDENSDPNVGLHTKNSTSHQNSDQQSLMGDPPDISALTDPSPSHGVTVDTSMQPKAIDESSIQMLTSPLANVNSSSLIRAIVKLCKRGWSVDLIWIARSSNQAVDALAKRVDVSAFDTIDLHTPPEYLRPLLSHDVSSFSFDLA